MLQRVISDLTGPLPPSKLAFVRQLRGGASLEVDTAWVALNFHEE